MHDTTTIKLFGTGADPEKNLTGFQPLYYICRPRIYNMVIFRVIFYLRTFRKVYNFQYYYYYFFWYLGLTDEPIL